MTVLAPQHEAIVKRVVESGRFGSAEEVIDAALTRLEEEEMVRQMRLERLRQDVGRGIEQVDRGQVKKLDPRDMKQRVRAVLKTSSDS